MATDDNDTQIRIIKIFAPNKANLFCLNIFGIKQIDIILVLILHKISVDIFKKTLNLKSITKQNIY